MPLLMSKIARHRDQVRSKCITIAPAGSVLAGAMLLGQNRGR